MRHSILTILVVISLLWAPFQAHAFDQAQFTSLLRDYQSLCSRMIAAPLAFHTDPKGSFAINGEEELFGTDDQSHVDYYVETLPQGQAGTRSFGIVSVRVANLVEQSCQVADATEQAASDDQIGQLADAVLAMFRGSPDFEISGGRQNTAEYSGYAFAVTGLFLGVDVISLITIDNGFLSLEHIHISKLSD